MSDTTAPPRRRIELTRAESLRLLRTVSLGRVVFTRRALPAIRPVNHVVDGGHIVIRTHEGTALAGLAATAQQPGTAAVRRVVVAYEADAIDPVTHLGWSVVVTGYCMPVTDPDELASCAALLKPWWDGRMDYAVRIRPTLVTGVRLVPGCPHPPAPAC
ncbi:pyridoxamine 5'-phosphate oxidase family protein [Streptomyces roseoverticillatus]|uniref:Pyridoxamine 5'-phosphate oxidase family protein n=1 Tax=Streptomyces roseoverticillatus TaxID=66429 RepID=A0ABV3J2D3_9ACTN